MTRGDELVEQFKDVLASISAICHFAPTLDREEVIDIFRRLFCFVDARQTVELSRAMAALLKESKPAMEHEVSIRLAHMKEIADEAERVHAAQMQWFNERFKD